MCVSRYLALMRVIALCAMTSAEIYAQEDPPDPLTTTEVEVRATRLPPSDLEETALGRVYTRSPNTLFTTLTDWLSTLPALNIQSFGGPLQPARIGVRGAAANQTLVTFAGMRLNSLTTGALDLALIPLSALESITILRGAGAMQHGSGAEGGVIALEPARLPWGVDHDAQAGVSLGSFGTWKLHAHTAHRVEAQTEVAAGIAYTQTTGDFRFVDAQDTEHVRLNNDGEQIAGHLRAALGELGMPRLELVHLTSYTERGAPGPSEFANRFLDARLADLLSLTSLRGELPEMADTALGALSLEGRLSYRHASSTYQNTTALLGNQAVRNEHDEHSLEQQLTLRAQHLENLTGFAVLDIRYDHLLRRSPDAEASRWAFGLTLLENASFWDEALQASVGLRAEIDNQGHRALVPRVGLSAHVFSWLRVAGNLGRAYRLPTFDELYLRNEFVRGNPELDPEDATSADLGLFFTPVDTLEIEAVGFAQSYERLILFVPNAFFFQAQNLSGASVFGLELAARYALLEQHLHLEASYTLTQAQFDAPPRDPLPGRARHAAHVSVSGRYDRVGGRLHLGYLSERPLDLFGNATAPARLLLDATLSFKLPAGFILLAEARNLLGVKDALDTLQSPLPPRSFHAALTWHLNAGE